jgi:hypothetical protein
VPAGKTGSCKGLNDNYGDYSLSRLVGLPFAYPSPPIQNLGSVEGTHQLCKTALQFSPLLGVSGARSLHHSDVPALHHHAVPH